MRRIFLPLLLSLIVGWAAPSHAQWWRGGWERPCFDACGPGTGPAYGDWERPTRFSVVGPAPPPFWARRGAFGPPRFRAFGWENGWPAVARREMRWRRFEAWRRWIDMSRRSALPGATVRAHAGPARPAVLVQARRPVVPAVRVPARPEVTVTMLPTGSLHAARPQRRAIVPPRILATAAMGGRPAVASAGPMPSLSTAVRIPGRARDTVPPSAALHSTQSAAPIPHRPIQPVALRSQPAVQPEMTSGAPAAQASPAVPAPPVPGPEPIPPTNVPVAPLD